MEISSLSVENLNQILDYLSDDKYSIYSCLLVNRTFCKISVPILWNNIWMYRKQLSNKKQKETDVLLYKTIKKVIYPVNTQKNLLFNYQSFCKKLSFFAITDFVENISTCFDDKIILLKLVTTIFLKENTSKKRLSFHSSFNFPITDFPNLQCLSFEISYEKNLSMSVKEILLSSFNSIKELRIIALNGENDWNDIIPVLSSKRYDSLKTFYIYGFKPSNISFIKNFSNLQELGYDLIRTTLSKIHILSIPNYCLSIKSLIINVNEKDYLHILKGVLSCFEKLESLEVFYEDTIFYEKVLDVIITDPNNNLSKLKINSGKRRELNHDYLKYIAERKKNKKQLELSFRNVLVNKAIGFNFENIIIVENDNDNRCNIEYIESTNSEEFKKRNFHRIYEYPF